MSYALGVDVGTSHTAAAVWHDGAVHPLPLVPGAAAGGAIPESPPVVLPSVVFLQQDGSLLVGAEADDRGAAEPERVARGFWPQLADPVPRLLGDETVTTGELVAALLEYVVATATYRHGEPPGYVTLTCPGAWGPHLRLALTRAAQDAGLTDVGLVSDAVAAAVHHATSDPVPAGTRLLVYDLGVDLDVSVVARTATGYEQLGRPGHDAGVGGEHVDELLMTRLRTALGDQWPTDGGDAWRLRRAAVAAKERLSSDRATEIPVELPGRSLSVRHTRDELEAALRPLLEASLDVVDEVLRTAELERGDLDAVLLTGGSAALPLLSRVVGGAIEAPAVVARWPQLAVVLGAAVTASARLPAASPAGTLATSRQVGHADDDAAALAAPEPPGEPVDPPAVGVTAPLDVPLPTRPDPRRQPRRVVTEAFEYTPGPARSLARAGGLAFLVVLAAAAVAVLAVLVVRPGAAEPTSGDSGDAVPGRTGDETDLDDRADDQAGAPRLSTLTAATAQPVGGPDAEVVALAVLADGTVLAAGRAGEVAVPRLWRSSPAPAGSVAALAEVAGPSVAGGVQGSVEGVAVSGDVTVAVGWTAPETADPRDRSARSGVVWVSDAALTQPWRAVEVPGAGELTAVTVRSSGGFVAAGVDYAVDRVDGDGTVLESPDGQTWRAVAASGLDGPGPYRLVALAEASGQLLAVAERRDGAALRAALVGSGDGASWQELAPLDAPATRVADVGGLVSLGDGQVAAVGGVAPDQGLAWLGLADALAPARVRGLGPLSAVASSGDDLVVAGRTGGGDPPLVAVVPRASTGAG